MGRVSDALVFAAKAHGDQRRRYSGEFYVAHLIEVHRLVEQAGGTEDMQCAALLHDVVEDTPCTAIVIEFSFGENVAQMVLSLSDLETGNRATRKAASCARLGAASAEVQTIKLADLISNSRSIIERDPDFARTYLKEKVALLRVLDKGDRMLWNMAAKIIPDEYWT